MKIPPLLKRRKIVGAALVVSSLLFTSIAFADIIAGLSTTNVSNDVAYTALTLNKPSDSLQGDLLLANISVNGGSPAGITAPTGWTLIGRTDNDANVSITSFWKVAGTSDPSSYTWIINPQTRAAGGITRYSGVNLTNPVDTMASSTGRGFVATAPSVMTTHVNDRIIALVAIDAGKSNSSFFSTTTGMTKRYEVRNTPFGPTTAAEDVTQTAIGSSGTMDVTVSPGAQRDWVAQTIALQMAPTSITFTTPGVYTITIPSGVMSATVKMWGGGGAGGGSDGGRAGGGGGAGAYVTTTVTSPVGSATIYVGQGGQLSTGYGTGYANGGAGFEGGGGGGGSSAAVFNASSTVIIAAGGGGGGGEWGGSYGSGGQAASGTVGGQGGSRDGSGLAKGGGGGGAATAGGTAAGGGAGGIGATIATGTGGNGGNGAANNSGAGGGGSAAGASGNGNNGGNGSGNINAAGGNGSGGAPGGIGGCSPGSNGTIGESGGGGGGRGGTGNAGCDGGTPGAGGGAGGDSGWGNGGNGMVYLQFNF